MKIHENVHECCHERSRTSPEQFPKYSAMLSEMLKKVVRKVEDTEILKIDTILLRRFKWIVDTDVFGNSFDLLEDPSCLRQMGMSKRNA